MLEGVLESYFKCIIAQSVEVSTSDQLVKKAFSTVSSYIFLILQ